MFNRIVLLSLSLLLLLHLTLSYQTPQSLYPQIQRQVVKIETIQGRGSGVILGNRGEVVTANHVLQGQTTVIAVTDSGKKVGCKVVRTDVERDLAMLMCAGFRGTNGVDKFSSLALPLGHRVVVAGYPGGRCLISTDGIIANRMDDKGKLFISSLIGPGMSGGAVFTYDGALVGIIQAIYRMPPFTAVTTSTIQLYRFLHLK